MFMQFIVLAHLKGLKVDGTQDSKRRQQPVSLTDDLFRHFFFFFFCFSLNNFALLVHLLLLLKICLQMGKMSESSRSPDTLSYQAYVNDELLSALKFAGAASLNCA